MRKPLSVKGDFIAVKPTSNWGGIGIYEVDPNSETVKFAYDSGNKRSKPYRSAVRYNSKGDPFFVSNGKRHYISEFQRTGR